MADFEVDGVHYRTKLRLNARQQFHIARRLAPLLAHFPLAVAPVLDNAPQDAEAAVQHEAALTPFAEALARIPDQDCDYVLDLCMSVVQRSHSGNGQGVTWADIWNPRAGRLMYDDIALPAMIRIAYAVLEENLSGFFVTPPNVGTATGTPTSMAP